MSPLGVIDEHKGEGVGGLTTSYAMVPAGERRSGHERDDHGVDHGVANNEVLADEVLKNSLVEVLQDLHTRAADLFRAWDEENTGSVSQDDFRRALKALGFLNTPNEELDALFNLLDTDRVRDPFRMH